MVLGAFDIKLVLVQVFCCITCPAVIPMLQEVGLCSSVSLLFSDVGKVIWLSRSTINVEQARKLSP